MFLMSGLENRDYGRRRSAALTMRHPSVRKKLALTSPTSGGRSVGIVRSRTKATELITIMFLMFRVRKIVGRNLELKLDNTNKRRRCHRRRFGKYSITKQVVL
jgi:hypothetical protein